jgi:hypothetical protein
VGFWGGVRHQSLRRSHITTFDLHSTACRVSLRHIQSLLLPSSALTSFGMWLFVGQRGGRWQKPSASVRCCFAVRATDLVIGFTSISFHLISFFVRCTALAHVPSSRSADTWLCGLSSDFKGLKFKAMCLVTELQRGSLKKLLYFRPSV